MPKPNIRNSAEKRAAAIARGDMIEARPGETYA